MLESLIGSSVHEGESRPSHSFYFHVCRCTCTCSHSWWDDIKSRNLLVYHDTWLFRIQVTKRSSKVWSGMMASGIVDENYTRVTDWWRRVIYVDSDYLQGLAWLGNKVLQILGGTVQAARRQGMHAPCNFWNEQSTGFGQLDFCNFLEERVGLHDGPLGRDCAIFLGNCLGDWHPELRNSQRELPVCY